VIKEKKEEFDQRKTAINVIKDFTNNDDGECILYIEKEHETFVFECVECGLYNIVHVC